MYTLLIIFVLASAVIAYFFIYDGETYGFSICIGSILGFFVAILSALFLTFVGINELSVPENTQKEYKRIDIKKLSDGSSSYGSYFLLSGSSHDELEYRYLTEDEDGFLSYNRIAAKNVKINYNDLGEDETPYIMQITTSLKPNIEWWVIPSSEKEYILYIRKDMILFDYNIDLE